MNPRLSLICALWTIIGAGCATTKLVEIPVMLGRQDFQPGDGIAIKQVLASSPYLQAGDRVVVRGSYLLQSEPEANLGLSLSTTTPITTHVASTQSTRVAAGAGDFELSCRLPVAGELHVSFSQSHGSFGGVYISPPQRLIDMAGLVEVPVVVGQQKFEPGDAIAVDRVLASSPNFSAGDKVVVFGHYQLQSEPEATLGLSVTTPRNAGPAPRGLPPDGPERRQDVGPGSGDFVLACTVPQQGHLHVSFNSAQLHRSFGTVYFEPATKAAR